MTQFKGTPGPWEMLPEEVDKAYIRIRGTRLGCRYKIANVLTPVHEGVDPREANETRANAQLIATAPELLAELQRVTAALHGLIVENNNGDVAVQARLTDELCKPAYDLIKKALGEK